MRAAIGSRSGKMRHWKGLKVPTKHFTLLTDWSKHVNRVQDCWVQIVQICFEMLNWVKFAPELYMCGRVLLEGPKNDFELMHSPPSFDYVKQFEPRVLVSNWLARIMKGFSVLRTVAQQSWFNAKTAAWIFAEMPPQLLLLLAPRRSWRLSLFNFMQRRRIGSEHWHLTGADLRIWRNMTTESTMLSAWNRLFELVASCKRKTHFATRNSCLGSASCPTQSGLSLPRSQVWLTWSLLHHLVAVCETWSYLIAWWSFENLWKLYSDLTERQLSPSLIFWVPGFADNCIMKGQLITCTWGRWHWGTVTRTNKFQGDQIGLGGSCAGMQTCTQLILA